VRTASIELAKPEEIELAMDVDPRPVAEPNTPVVILNTVKDLNARVTLAIYSHDLNGRR